MYTRRYKFRLGFITLIFIILLILILLRVVYFQIPFHKKALLYANNQHTVRIELEPRRGAILDRNMRKLAINLRVDSIYAVSRNIKRKREIAKLIAPILEKQEELIFDRLSRDKLFVWLARKVPEDVAKKIKALDINGIELLSETKRFYPNKNLASQVIGFAGTDNIGLEGIEKYYDKYMRGESGYKVVVRDAKQREVHAFGGTYINPVDGYDVVLTIDEVIQHIAEKALAKIYNKHSAKGAICIVMDPNTGQILAMATEPSFDLNEFGQADQEAKRIRSITDYYEPGSVFKAITASACLDSKVVTEDDRFFCENGKWYVAGHTLHDAHEFGDLNFREVIEKSSNIGTVKAAIKLGEKDLYKHIKAYGFGKATGIDLPGEISGMIRPLREWSKYSITAIPIGHEIGVTPIQLATAMAAIANGGTLLKPYVINEIRDSKGQIIKKNKPQIVRRVASEHSMGVLKSILQGVVENGTGKRAKVKEFTTAGKTGTAQKIEPNGRYSHRNYISSFVGFAPVKEPKIVVSVIVDEPRNGYYASIVAAPVFKEVSEATLRYLGITPDKLKGKT